MKHGEREQLLKSLEVDAGSLIDRLRNLSSRVAPFPDETDDDRLELPDKEHFVRLNTALKGGAVLADELHQALKVL